MNRKPLFVTGIARCGSTLLAKILDIHPKISLASDPILPLLRTFRNAILVNSKRSYRRDVEHLPFLDYYFDEEYSRILEDVLQGTLELPYAEQGMPALRDALAARAVYESPELVPFFKTLRPGNFREIFEEVLENIANRFGKDAPWAGLKDLWAIELNEVLARSWPEARFIVLMRDPRATLSSMLAGAKEDPAQRAHVLSFLRHWRKYVSFLMRWENTKQGSITHTILYENLVTHPKDELEKLCRFLDIDVVPALVDSSLFKASDGTIWKGNSSYTQTFSGIETQSLNKWTERLNPEAICLTEFACGHDMRYLGYTPIHDLDDPSLSERAIQYLLKTASDEVSWRSDFENPSIDIGCELLRNLLLAMGPVTDEALIKSAFLFQEAYAALRK